MRNNNGTLTRGNPDGNVGSIPAIQQGQIVRLEVDMDRGTLGICVVASVDTEDVVPAQFTDLRGQTVYPAVYFYSNGPSVTWLDFVRL